MANNFKVMPLNKLHTEAETTDRAILTTTGTPEDGDLTLMNEVINAAIAQDPDESRVSMFPFPIQRAAQPISLTYAPHGTDYVYSTRGVTTQMGRMRYTSPPWASRRFQLCFAQWMISVLGVRTDSAQVALRCSIEYPSGTMHPVYFNGSRDAKISPSGLVLSDPVDIQIPASTNYWIRVFAVCETGDLYLVKKTAFIKNTGGMVIGVQGAAATATLAQTGGVINAVAITTKGSGYPPNTEIDCTITGAGSGASIKAVVSATGVIDGYRIVSGGTGYTGTPTIAIPGNATGSSAYGGVPVDQTTIGTIADYASAFGLFGPSAILAIPADTSGHRSYAIVGDSIGTGYYDTDVGVNGWPKRVFDSTGIPMVNLSFGGASLWRSWPVAGTAAAHLGLAEGCTDAIIALGRNDLTDSRTLVQMQEDFTTLATALINRGMRVHAATVTPGTNATNTAVLGTESIRVGFNDWLRTLPAGITTCFDTADATETSRNSGYWKTGDYYTDGIHVTAQGFDHMATAFSGIIA